MGSFVRAALLGALCSFCFSTAWSSDFGRTAGTFSVSNGAATYTIPIWTPPGPNGVQPSIALNYASPGIYGLAGAGWNLSAISSIERCNRTIGQDGFTGGIEMSLSDRYCIGGNRLRLQVGTYGAANSVYYTEFADYSRIKAFGTVGAGVQYFVVEAKSGLKYEYGNTTDSRVFAGVPPGFVSTTPARWMLNRVYDRNGNQYVISYNNSNGFAVPDVISWTPTSLGASTYRYEAKFNYINNRADSDSYLGKIYGYDVANRYRLESIQIKSAGVVKRKYRFTYNTSAVTSRSLLAQARECADDAETNCLLPLTFSYQAGASGLASGGGTPPAGSSNGVIVGRYDFNGDGKDDIAYSNGSSWSVALSTNAGFSATYSTGITGAVVVDRFLPPGRAAFLASVSGVLWTYRWDDSTSTFVGSSTGITSALPTAVIDFNGDRMADLVYYSGGTAINVRMNTSTGSGSPSFASSASATAQLTGNLQYAGFQVLGTGAYRNSDINGDGRNDVRVQIVTTGIGGGTVRTAYLYGSSVGFDIPAQSEWINGTPPSETTINFNGDRCADRLVSTFGIAVSNCAGSTSTGVTLPGTPKLYLDWDGDGKMDLAVDNGGTLGIYRSTGAGFSSLITTSVPSTGAFFAIDQDGDGLDDLIKINGTSAVSYWTHTSSGVVPTYATNLPDLLSSVVDGYGVTTSPDYVSTAAYNYSPGTTTAAPLQETGPAIVVARTTHSNGINGTYTMSYFYVGARFNSSRQEFAGYQRIDVIDSRNGFIARTYADQLFPVAGMVSQLELMQANGVTTISRQVNTNSFTTLDATANNQRYLVFQSASTATQYEVGGTLNGNLLRTVTTSNTFDTTSGEPYDTTITTTEPSSGANGQTPGGSWVEHTYVPLANLVDDTTNWCLGRPGQVQQINSNNLTYGAQLTRTTNTTWDIAHCRPTQVQVEPTSSTLQVTTDIGYDSFGNVNSTTVTGMNAGVSMTPRTSTSVYADATSTTGQFPLSATNALSQTSTAAWNYDLGVPASATDANGIIVSWQYDAFGRRSRETRPDGTSTAWDYKECVSCDARVHMYIEQTTRDSSNATTDRFISYLDQFDRSINDSQLRADSNWNVSSRSFDSLGRVAIEYFPYVIGATTYGGTTFTYDDLDRPKIISRRISDSNSTEQTTNISYEGLKTTAIDAQGKKTIRVASSHGELVRSEDDAGYYQRFDYDAFGGVKRVQDTAGNTLQSSTYNLRGMLTQRVDMDMGTWNFAPNSLGEVVSQTDAKSQTTTFQFDLLGRLTNRTEAEGTSTWTWGASSASKNIGKLASLSGPGGYSESYSYDSLSRPSATTITADTTYQIDFTYNSSGKIDTLTYPTSTSSYRLKLQYLYANGYLSQIKDYNAPNTVFWTANAFNSRDEITQATLGNGIVLSNAFDAVTGWLKSIQSGVGGGSSVQNLAYTWDLVGNLLSRKDINQSNLTETFAYDNLYRLDYSQLNGVQNLDMAYDALGNITSKSDVGAYTYDPTKKHQLASTSNGWSFSYDNNGNLQAGRGATITWTSYNYPSQISSGGLNSSFSYTPERQYYKQVADFSNGTATTMYIAGILEKVTTAAGTDFRHMIRAGGSTIIVSRQTSGTNTTNYVTTDHLGSSSAITNSAGNMLVNLSFAAFGARRGANWSGSPSSGDWMAIASTTRRGYTGHTMLDNVNFIHMNGRVQDPLLGRFVSADPLIAQPAFTQSYNRYSYVFNNPLSYTDPSGFCAANQEMVYLDGDQEVVPENDRPKSDGYKNGETSASGRHIGCREVVTSEGRKPQDPQNPRVDPDPKLPTIAVDDSNRGPQGQCPNDGSAKPGDAGPNVASAAAGATAIDQPWPVELPGLTPLIRVSPLLLPLVLTGDTVSRPNQIVIRGGWATPDNLITGTTIVKGYEPLTGFSVTTAPNMSATELALAANYPHNVVSITTTAALSEIGANVYATPMLPHKPLHGTVGANIPLSPARAAELSAVWQRIPNPAKCIPSP